MSHTPTPNPNEAQFVRRVLEPRAPSSEPGRHSARRAAMMVLYRADLLHDDVASVIERFASDNGYEMPQYTEVVVRGVLGDIKELDQEISAHLEEWSVDRLGVVERAILRVAMWELAKQNDVPAPVAIDEAVELTKRYATPEASKLVNGVLASWLRANNESDQS